MNLFSEDSLVSRIFEFLGHMILLNILWIVISLPVVTAGASTTAMYYVTMKMHKDKEVSVWKGFFHSFKQNFVQSTVIWLILLTAAFFLYAGGKWLIFTGNELSLLLSYAIIGVGMILAVLFLYIFPVIAAFANKLGILTGHAFYFAFHKPGYLLATAAVTFFPMYFTMVDAVLFPVYLLIWLMVGFSLTAYGNSWFYLRLFKPYYEHLTGPSCS